MRHLLILAAILSIGGGAILAIIAGGWLLDRWASRPAEMGGAHRAVEEPLPSYRPGIGSGESRGSSRYAALAELDAAPVEVIRLTQERTEETPVLEAGAPVEHVEVAEDPPEEGAIGTMAAEESPEMADAAWRHDHDQRWTQLLVGWAQRPDWLAEFGAGSLQLPEYRRLVLEHTGEIPMAELLKAGVR